MAGSPQVPQLLPVLSRGKHRKPSKGACFMELAAFLAGEPWSDHPACTHPLLARVARLVNDHTSDANRNRLAPLIPSVIGRTSDDVAVDARIALRCARTALPVAAEATQRVLAVSVLTAERVLNRLEERPAGYREATSQDALDSAPLAAAWATKLAADVGVSTQGYRRHAAPAAVDCAVRGIAHAVIRDADDLLYGLLAGCIGEIPAPASTEPSRGVDKDAWQSVCRLTGVR
jgi:hypothetical protein